MKVRFKNNTEPCIQYEVKNETPILNYDEILEKYCECIEIALCGLVPKELLTETTHPENVNAVDVAIYLTNQK